MNPSWAALKYFDEQQFLRIVQGQGSIDSSHVLGRLPRKLNLPADSSRMPPLQHSRTGSQNNALRPAPPSHYNSISSRVSNVSRKSSFTSNSSPSNLRQSNLHQSQSSSQLRQHNLVSGSASLLQSPKYQEGHHGYSSSPSLLKKGNGKTQSNTDEHAPVKTAPESKIANLEELMFEHFTYGGEDIQLFSKKNAPTASCSSPVSPYHSSKRHTLDNNSDIHVMTYDNTFQLSPPPPKRRGSLTTSFNSLSFCSPDNQHSGVKLTRSPSFSSIII